MYEMEPSVEIRSPTHRPILNHICSSSTHRVTFHHPAYDSTRLFDVPAFDSPNGGIHYGTALFLCGIVAGGVWNGWLTETPVGRRLDVEVDTLLMGRDYYFHVPLPTQDNLDQDTLSRPYKYPVVLSFQHWQFPHNNPPPRWTFIPDLSEITPSLFPIPSISSVSQAIRDRDICCRLSGYQDGIERAHLCPRSELEWFTTQEMDRYNTNQSLSGANLVDDMANALALRRDIHAMYNAGMFVFTRKRDSWVPHFLAPTRNLGPEYHNVAIEMPAAVHPAFLLTRLAWAILPRIRNFLTRGEKRVVKLSKSSGLEDIKELSGEEISGILGVCARARSSSPKKRQREGDTTIDSAGTVAGVWKRPRHTYGGSDQAGQPHFHTDVLPAATPDLYDVASNSSSSQPELSGNPDSSHGLHERTRIAKLRHRALVAQRQIPPHLVCCDYNVAEMANSNGIQGPDEFGGAHLCMRCLGADFTDDKVSPVKERHSWSQGDPEPYLNTEDGLP